MDRIAGRCGRRWGGLDGPATAEFGRIATDGGRDDLRKPISALIGEVTGVVAVYLQ